MIINDLELIEKVKNEQDSEALSELTNRHTGLYISLVNKYSNYSKSSVEFDDLKDDRLFYIHKWLLKYDPTKNMKFSTFVGENTKYVCKNLLRSINNKPTFETEEALENMKDQDITSLNCDNNDVDSLVKDSDSKKFEKIVSLRNEGKTWKQIGKALSMSHEAVRKNFYRNIEKIKNHVNWKETCSRSTIK